jgi:hypothetical protein
MTDRLYQKDVARELGVSVPKMLAMTRAGDIPHSTEDYVTGAGEPATRFVWYRSEIEAWKRRRGELWAERTDGAA